MENTFTKKFTFTAVRESDTSVETLCFESEKWFLRTMCESQAAGFKILFAATIVAGKDGRVLDTTTLTKYMSEI